MEISGFRPGQEERSLKSSSKASVRGKIDLARNRALIVNSSDAAVGDKVHYSQLKIRDKSPSGMKSSPSGHGELQSRAVTEFLFTAKPRSLVGNLSGQSGSRGEEVGQKNVEEGGEEPMVGVLDGHADGNGGGTVGIGINSSNFSKPCSVQGDSFGVLDRT